MNADIQEKLCREYVMNLSDRDFRLLRAMVYERQEREDEREAGEYAGEIPEALAAEVARLVNAKSLVGAVTAIRAQYPELSVKVAIRLAHFFAGELAQPL